MASLSGAFRLGSYGRNELLGNQYWLLQGAYERKVFHLPHSSAKASMQSASSREARSTTTSTPSTNVNPKPGTAASPSSSAPPSAPSNIGGAAGSNDHRKWWFGLGHVF
ncbi:hypothetical protein [Tunturiibacter gelidiferens]|uniref:hypothetical protein n=1 Tax=Tunturiibacter gelidiferens TaxID=3069689 RepID=UPI003D9BF240